jgi:hypothetical protein
VTKKKSKPKKPQYGLCKYTTRKNARSFVDFDYLDKLSPEELKWLDQFSQEFYQSRFKKFRPDLDLHHTQELRRAVYRANNERNRDVWNEFLRVPIDLTDAIEMDPQSDKPTKNHKKSTKEDPEEPEQ